MHLEEQLTSTTATSVSLLGPVPSILCTDDPLQIWTWAEAYEDALPSPELYKWSYSSGNPNSWPKHLRRDPPLQLLPSKSVTRIVIPISSSCYKLHPPSRLPHVNANVVQAPFVGLITTREHPWVRMDFPTLHCSISTMTPQWAWIR